MRFHSVSVNMSKQMCKSTVKTVKVFTTTQTSLKDYPPTLTHTLRSIIKANWSTCIDVNGELLIGRWSEPESWPLVIEVHSARLSSFKLSQQPLLQLLLRLLPQRHICSSAAPRSRLETLFEAAHQPEELLLLFRAVELGGAPLAQTLRDRDIGDEY